MVLIGAIAFFLYKQTVGAPVVGTITGPEWEYMTVGGKTYVIAHDAPVNGTDKGPFIGIATNDAAKFRVYSIKGSDEYLYCRWEWEGEIYKRIQ